MIGRRRWIGGSGSAAVDRRRWIGGDGSMAVDRAGRIGGEVARFLSRQRAHQVSHAVLERLVAPDRLAEVQPDLAILRDDCGSPGPAPDPKRYLLPIGRA